MSTSSPPRTPTVDVVQEETSPSGGVTTTITAVAIIPALFALLFHAGAAYMSYQRNQSFGWAILHFFLAVFYYPYFAFTQAGKPAEEPPSLLPTVQAAGKRLRKFVHGKKH
jgi:hypothetical protein